MAINIQKGLFRVYTVFSVIIFIISFILIAEDMYHPEWTDYLIATLISLLFGVIPWGIHYLIKWMIKGFFDDRNKPEDSPEEERNALFTQSPDNAKPLPMEYSEIAQKEGGVPFAWRRFWARMIDISCIGVLSSFSIQLLIALLLSAFPNIEKEMLKVISSNPLYYFFMVLIAFALIIFVQILYEAIFLTLFGTTIGKALFGMRVQNKDGSKLHFKTAFRRSVSVYAKGLWFLIGFPGLSIWPLLQSYNFTRNAHETPWDQDCNTTLFLKHIWLFRAFIMSVVGCTCVLGFLAFQRVAIEENKKIIGDVFTNVAIEKHRAYIETQIEKIVLETNRELPQWWSPDLRLDKLVSRGNTTLEFVYTRTSSYDIFAKPATIENRYKPSCLEYIKTNLELEPLRKNSVTFIFTYLTEDGHKVTSFKVLSKDYR